MRPKEIKWLSYRHSAGKNRLELRSSGSLSRLFLINLISVFKSLLVALGASVFPNQNL